MKNKKVDEYIRKQKSPQKQICKKLRAIILKTLPNVGEEFKLGVPWYGDRIYIVGLKDHVNLGFSLTGLSKKEINSLEGGGKTMRHLKFFSVKDVEEKKLARLIKHTKKCGSCSK